KSVYSYNANAPVADGRLYVDKPRRFANLPDIYYDTNGAFHQYNGLTFEVKRQTVKGLYIQSAWTWARDIHDMDYNWDYDTWLYTTEDPTNRRRERGVARDIPTHRWTTNSIYQMPFGKGQPLLANSSRLVNQLVGGWEISGMYTLQSGEFLTPMWSGEDPVGITYTDGDPAWVTMRPDILRNPNLPSGRRSIQSWFDGAAFADPKPGHFGTSAKGTVIGPGINTGNFGVYKTFFLRGETMKLRWEMVANNIFNHANWGTPNLDMTDPAVGSITSTGGNSAADMRGPRWFRMGLRLTW
ncbi:MAG: hypothetical protein NTY38_20495, partial [Acidobacteria bacterium]|nr:hypothetical protein [Acidobacteriota bacterium]